MAINLRVFHLPLVTWRFAVRIKVGQLLGLAPHMVYARKAYCVTLLFAALSVRLLKLGWAYKRKYAPYHVGLRAADPEKLRSLTKFYALTPQKAWTTY